MTRSSVRPLSFLRRHGAALLALGILFWPQPVIRGLRSPNELVRVYSTLAMVQDGSLSIDGPVARYGLLTDRAEKDGRFYSDKAPGLSLLAAPFAALAQACGLLEDTTPDALLPWARRLLLVLPTGGWLLLLPGWLLQLGLSRPWAAMGPAVLALGTPIFPYSQQFVGHQAAGWMLGFMWLCAWRAQRPPTPPSGPRGPGPSIGWATAAGFFGGLAAITEYPTVVVVPLGAVLALAGPPPRPPRWARLGGFVLGAALPLGAGALYHHLAFGSPLATGYTYLVDPAFRRVHATGFLGVSWPRPEVVWNLLFGTQRGLFVLCPWLLLGILGLVPSIQHLVSSLSTRLAAFRGSGRSRGNPPGDPHQTLAQTLLGAHLGAQLVIAAGFGYWLGGWSVGPRHLVSAMPAWGALALAGGQWLSRRLTLAPVLTAGAMLVGMLSMTAVSLTYPGFPEELHHPLVQQALPLLGDGQFGHSLGSHLGWGVHLGMAPALLGVGALAGWIAAGAPQARTHLEASLVRVVGSMGMAAAFLFAIARVPYLETPQAVFRVAWLRQTMWEPPSAIPPLDPRLAQWEKATRAVAQGRGRPEDFEAIGAMHARLGNAHAAEAAFLRAAKARGEEQTPTSPGGGTSAPGRPLPPSPHE